MPTQVLTPASRRATRLQAIASGFAKGLGHKAPGPAHVHRMRVAVKKLRSWIRLLRFAEKQQIGVRVDHALRTVAHGLAADRDRYVMVQTLGLLRAEAHTAGERHAVAELRRRLHAPVVAAALPAFPAEMLDTLQRLCRRQPDTAALSRGFERSYRRTRRLGARAGLPEATPALRHAWRRRVKYLYYQSRFLCAGGKTAWQRRLDDLGTVLGELHDLHVLDTRLRALQADAATASARRLLAAATRRRLARVRRLYGRCFAQRHKRLRAGLRRNVIERGV